ncbi:MAG: hypothetical protein K8T91_23885 [Planctomycetes bacterium]|nr:hypothetical protein [Planctomycetota bacterium]
MKFDNIHTFEELRDYLSKFHSWGGDQAYDIGGAIILFAAILDNLSRSPDEVIEILAGYLNSDQKIFLAKLADCANRPDEE